MIDIIIPAFNAHDTIERAIASVIAQTAIDQIKITIVDDCSSVGYAACIDKFKHLVPIREIRLTVNGGPGVARQAGIDITEQKYIAFLDADDVLYTAASIAKLLTVMEEEPKIYMVSSYFYEELPNGSFLSHENDTTWVFGKVYRREYLDRHQIRFNTTRANEDLGFNTKVRSRATQKDMIYFLYEYANRDGFLGFIQNKKEALAHPKAELQFVADDGIKTIISCYFMFCDVLQETPKNKDASLAALRDFWKAIGRDIYRGSPQWIVADAFNEVARKWGRQRSIPSITMSEFINMMEEG
jgi:glycosyltransferase involved in cell wall biosynthesis